MEHTKAKTFKELPTRLIVVASDVASETPYIFSSDKTPEARVAWAARASASIPLVYTPVTVGSALLMDGGMEDNIPGDLLTEDPIPRIAIQLVSTETPLDTSDHSLTNVVPRLLDLMLTATENAHASIAQKSGANFAFVETGFAGALDSNMNYEIRHRLMDAGYEATMATLKTLK
jgi:NTE family protein